MGAGTLEFGGYIYNGAGSPVVGAALSLFPRNTTCSATTTTTTNCSGYWTMSTTTQNQYDVRISDCCATIIRYLKYDDAIQVKSVEALQFRMRSATGTSGFDYDIVPGSIAAARTLNLPVITGTDTLATLGLAATYSAIMTHSADIIIQDASDLALGSGSDALFRWSTGDADNHSLVIATGNSNQALHITDVGAVATDWAIAATTHPNVYIHSNTTPATDYLRLGDHDGTTAYVDVVGGTTLALEIAGNTEATITASGLTLPANSDLIFTGGTGTNDIVLANGLADALSVTDGSADVLVIDTSTSGNVITASSAVTVGVDDTGHDVKFFGASAGAYLIYDQSEDRLEIRGPSADATTSTGKLLLSTALTDINANDVIGKIDFQAPLEAGGTDAITVAASIQAIAQGTFSASVNSTDLIFYTGHSEAATEKFRFTSQGELGIGGATYGSSGDVLTSGGAGAAPTWETPTTGDITSVTAGVGLSGGDTSGDVTLTLDISELSTVTPANGDFFATLDSDGSTEQKTTTTALATLLAGTVTSTGLAASSSVLTLDIQNMTASTTIADADLLVIDDGAGGTLRKMTRANFIESAALDAINIDGGAIDAVTLGTNSAVTELQVDYINANASTVTVTDSSDTGDYASLAVATHGATTLTTVDDDAAAANLNFVVDGAVDVDAAGLINLDSGSGIITFEDGGTEVLRLTEGNSGDVTVKLVTNAKDLIFTDNGDVEGFRILDAAAGVKVPGEVMTTKISYTDGDDAITIADGGGITAAAGITSTAATNAFGALTTSTIVASGIVKTDDTTNATSTTDGSLQTDGGLSVALDAIFGDDVTLITDSAVLNLGVGSDVSITHDGDTGGTISGTPMVYQSLAAASLANDTHAGIVLEFLAGESIAVGQLVYMSTVDGRVSLADANDTGDSGHYPAIGVAVSAQGSAGSAVKILTHGTFNDSDGFGGDLTEGNVLYLSETAGGFVATAPSDDGDMVQVVGIAIGPRDVFINCSLDVIEHA